MVVEHSALHIGLVSAGFAISILGGFYLSAQAIGFNNLKTLQRNFSKIIDTLAPAEIVFVDLETQDSESWSPKRSLFKRSISMTITVLQFLSFILHGILLVGVIHAIIGVILVILWIFIPPLFGLTINTWLKVIVAIILYVVGGHILFGEKPHEVFAWILKIVPNLLRRHFEWIEEGTRQSGRTGIVGFLLLCMGLSCQFVANLLF